jgi:protein TonB
MAAIVNDVARGRLGRPIAWSAGLHLAFAAFVILYATFMPNFRGQGWGAGGGGEAMGATLVSTVPLPANPQQTNNVLATESKGLSQSEPKPQEKEVEPEAIPIPDKNAKTKTPKKPPVTTATTRKPQPEPDESNRIPYGEGGAAGKLFSMSAGGATGAIDFPGGGGDFGSRYAWYVRVIQQKVQENWLKYEVDPRISTANRVFVTFDVTRDGHPSHVQIEQSSGVPSLDISAVRAIERIDTFGPLPADYSGSKISVEWWFDYSKK